MFEDEMLFYKHHGRRRNTAFEDFATTMKGTTVTTTIRETAEAQLQRNELERQRLLARLALLDKFEEVDPWGDETVITFKRSFGGPQTYTYVTIKVGTFWFVTGSKSAGRAYRWEELVEEHLAKSLPDSIYVADGWKRYEDVD